MNRLATIGGVVLLAVLLVLAIMGVRSCAQQPDADQVSATVVEPAREAGMAGAATDASAITANVMTQASESDVTTRENDRAIRQTPGAEATVPASVTAAGLRAQCMRQAYARDPSCAAVLSAGRQPAR